MAYQMSKRQLMISMVYGQAMIGVLTVLNVFFPEYLGYTFIIFIIGMGVFAALSARTMLKHVRSREAREIRSGKLLLKADPKVVKELQAADAERLTREMMPAAKAMLVPFLGLIVVFAWYPTYFGYATPIARSTDDVLVRVLIFLAGYEIPYSIIMGLNFLSRRALKEMVQVVQSYEVYDRGILGPGIVEFFPLDTKKYKVVYSPVRKFVELRKLGKPIVKFRFYTKRYERFIDILKRYGGVKDVERVE